MTAFVDSDFRQIGRNLCDADSVICPGKNRTGKAFDGISFSSSSTPDSELTDDKNHEKIIKTDNYFSKQCFFRP